MDDQVFSKVVSLEWNVWFNFFHSTVLALVSCAEEDEKNVLQVSQYDVYEKVDLVSWYCLFVRTA